MTLGSANAPWAVSRHSPIPIAHVTSVSYAEPVADLLSSAPDQEIRRRGLMLRRTAVRIAAGLAALLDGDGFVPAPGQMSRPAAPVSGLSQRGTQPHQSGTRAAKGAAWPHLQARCSRQQDDPRPKTSAARSYVINVWGSWCPPCRKEAPDLQAASVETKGCCPVRGHHEQGLRSGTGRGLRSSFKISYPSIYDPTGKVLLAFAGELPPQRHPLDHDHRPPGRLAVRVLSEVSKITLVDMINDVIDGR